MSPLGFAACQSKKCTNQANCSVCSVCSVGIFCSPTEFTEFTESTGRIILPQISQIYTDGACLEFCEFCVFCGTSHAPSESVKICAICGRIVLVAWGLPSYRIDWQRVSSHGIHRIHRSFACVFFPQNSQNSQKFRLRVLPTEFAEFTEV